MYNEKLSTDFHILFIKYGKNLPRSYFNMAVGFNRYGIKLIPVDYREIYKYLNRGEQFIISLSNTMLTRKSYMLAKKRILDFAVNNSRCVLFDISTFSNFSNFSAPVLKSCYHYIKLPEKTDTIVKSISRQYYSRLLEAKRWPGGKRVRLSSTVIEQAI